MVVASGGWVQDASSPANQNNSNLNINTAQNNKMTAKAILICRDNSHPFQERTLSLEQAVKIGRSVARARATPNNAIFDCKVLSRNHALLWYSGGKFFLQDTYSSNGTFVNNHRLSSSGVKSAPKEVCSGDIVQFGVDVVENTKKVTHECIVATLKLYLPDGKEAKASLSTSVTSQSAKNASNVSLENLYKLNEIVQEASKYEKALCSKLGYLQQLVSDTRKAANQSWKALITEDRLLSWVETIESQLAVYSENYTEDKIKNELVKLQEEKAQYQNAAKEALQKVLQEKLEITQRLVQLERRLSETEEECQSLHNVAKYTQNEFQELCGKYTETQKKLQETTNRLKESEDKIKEMVEYMEQENQELLKKFQQQSRVQQNLQEKLSGFSHIYKQLTALRNYLQVLQDRNIKLVTSDIIDSKDEENPIEIISVILNQLIAAHIDNTDNTRTYSETNLFLLKYEEDNEINSQLTGFSFSKEQLDDSLANNDNITEYILPPSSRKTLVNGNVNIDNSDTNLESDTISDATDDTCSITSDDVSEKSVIEVKEEEPVYDTAEEISIPYKAEVKFEENEEPSKEIDKQLETSHCPETVQKLNETEEVDINVENTNNMMLSEPISTNVSQQERKDETDKDNNELDEECEGEHLEGDYIKTLKPSSKNDTTQQCTHTREYILQTLIGSLDSLKVEDNVESQQAVNKELESLKDWFVCEPNEEVTEKLKELYYRAKNEAQRIQELHEELVILKEKYNVLIEEKTELSKKYTTLKAQCGDLLNTTYTVPIHYVAPIVIMLIWMLLEKIF